MGMISLSIYTFLYKPWYNSETLRYCLNNTQQMMKVFFILTHFLIHLTIRFIS